VGFILLPVTPSSLDIEASNVILEHLQKAAALSGVDDSVFTMSVA